MAVPSTSTFVAHDTREWLMAVFADAVYEQGYALTRLVDVSARGGVQPEDVARYWSTEEDCAIETVETAVQQVFSRFAETFMNTPGDCPVAAHQALAAMLEHLAGMPSMVHLAVLELPGISEHTRDLATAHLELFAEFLGPGLAVLDFEPSDPDLISLVVGGATLGLLRQYALKRRASELTETLSAVSYVCISSFFGLDEARRVLQLPSRLDPAGGD